VARYRKPYIDDNKRLLQLVAIPLKQRKATNVTRVHYHNIWFYNTTVVCSLFLVFVDSLKRVKLLNALPF